MSSLLLALCFALLLHRGNADTCNCNFLGYQSNTCGGTPTDNYNIAAGTTGVCTTFRWSGSIINNAGGYYKINSCGSSVSITVYSDSACATSTATKSWDAATRSWSQGFGDGSAPLWDAVLTAACGPQLRALDIVTHSDSIGGEEAKVFASLRHRPTVLHLALVFVDSIVTETALSELSCLTESKFVALSLNFGQNELSPKAIEALLSLQSSPHLRHFSLHTLLRWSEKTPPAALARFLDPRSLHSLHLHLGCVPGCTVSIPFAFPPAVNALRELTLDLSKMGLGPLGVAEALASIVHATTLHTLMLDLSRCPVSSAGPQLAALGALPRLRTLELRLAEARLVPGGCAWLAGWNASPQLAIVSLDLRQTGLGQDAVADLARLADLPCLRRLYINLSFNDVGPEEARALVAVARAPSLEALQVDLAGNRLGDSGLAALADLHLGPRLTELSLGFRSNGVTANGVCAVLEVAAMPNMRALSLDLRQNTFQDDSVCSIRCHPCPCLWLRLLEAKQLRKLEVWLPASQCGDSQMVALGELAALPHLEALSLHLTGQRMGRLGVGPLASLRFAAALRSLELHADDEPGPSPLAGLPGLGALTVLAACPSLERLVVRCPHACLTDVEAWAAYSFAATSSLMALSLCFATHRLSPGGWRWLRACEAGFEQRGGVLTVTCPGLRSRRVASCEPPCHYAPRRGVTQPGG